ncbi:FixH family protein [Neiella marina]|uniref:FixH family protein n=1 Tax=Neiella holothuriorum TaxID=2870530 RepID=A0ABS7EIN9_9GAMM|nr:FixH family protein [Neiella holothuriorum]MBW8191512.1 FixH family protein [Neiella holothuriorum]
MSVDTKPWYKQFWPWFILAFPLSAVVACFVTLFIFLGAQPDMVVDDYYKKGKAINFQKEKQSAALDLGLSAAVEITDAQITLRFEANEDALDGSALQLDFYHTTQAKRDFSVLAVLNGKGEYVAPLPKTIVNKWQLSIMPFDQRWRLRKTISLPHPGEINIDPLSH